MEIEKPSQRTESKNLSKRIADLRIKLQEAKEKEIENRKRGEGEPVSHLVQIDLDKLPDQDLKTILQWEDGTLTDVELQQWSREIDQAVNQETEEQNIGDDGEKNLFFIKHPRTQFNKWLRMQVAYEKGLGHLGNASEQSPSPLEQFREEISNYIAAEREKKRQWLARGKTGEAYDPHVDKNINPKHLTEDDREFWEKIKAGTITNDYIERYREKLSRQRDFLGSDEWESRATFQAMATNLAAGVFLRQLLEEEK